MRADSFSARDFPETYFKNACKLQKIAEVMFHDFRREDDLVLLNSTEEEIDHSTIERRAD